MKNYYEAQVMVIVDGNERVAVSISGQGYDPNVVKNSAIQKVKKSHEGKVFTSVIINKVDMDLEEYKKAIGGNPPWLGGDQF